MSRSKLVEYWYRAGNWPLLILLLLPFSWLFQFCIRIRRWLYQANLLKVQSFNTPILVVGNITVGGTGKTPFVIWLTAFLAAQGFRPGIVSRGVGGKKHKKPHWVTQQGEPTEVGDEAVLLHQNTACPVVVCIDRVAAVRHLLQRSNCNIIISDDGLQHYRLGRDIEIAMMDGEKRFGNQCLLPAGPLREPIARLKRVDFIIETYCQPGHVGHLNRDNQFKLTLVPSHFVSLQRKQTINFTEFPHKKLHALAGIGHPERFFQALQIAGFEIIPHVFPDHYLYQPHEISFADELPVIMTEKDAVKCIAFANDDCWYLSVIAKMNDNFAPALLAKLKSLERA